VDGWRSEWLNCCYLYGIPLSIKININIKYQRSIFIKNIKKEEMTQKQNGTKKHSHISIILVLAASGIRAKKYGEKEYQCYELDLDKAQMNLILILAILSTNVANLSKLLITWSCKIAIHYW
jgi:hypothetical protein